MIKDNPKEDVRLRSRGNPNGRVTGQNRSYENRATIAEVQGMPFRIDKHDAARILGRHPDTVTRLARRGEIPGARFEGGTWMFSTKMLIDYVEGRI